MSSIDTETEIVISMIGIATSAEIEESNELLDALALDGILPTPSSPVFAALAVRLALDALHDSERPLGLLEAFESVCAGYRDIINGRGQPQ